MERTWCVRLLLAFCEWLQGKFPPVPETVAQRYMGSGWEMPCICNICIRWRWVLSFTFKLLYLWVKLTFWRELICLFMERTWCIRLLLAFCERLQGKFPPVPETVAQRLMGSGCEMPCICNISIRWRWVVSFTFELLYLWGVGYCGIVTMTITVRHI